MQEHFAKCFDEKAVRLTPALGIADKGTLHHGVVRNAEEDARDSD